jgi:hypothetical protein
MKRDVPPEGMLRDLGLVEDTNNGHDSQTCALGTLLSAVEPERVSWLWERRVPLGKITVLDGDPGNGKSVLATDLAARLSAGHPFPDGQACEAAGAVILNAEDGLAHTVRPRLDAAGGDAERVLSLATVSTHEGDERPLSIPEDIPFIEEGVKSLSAKLVIVDPLMAFLSGTHNAHKDQDVRRALAPLAKMAERTGAAVLLVRHLNKAVGGKALYKGGGSIGIIGAARSGLLVGQHPEDEDLRVLAGQKSNLSSPPKSLAYTLTEAPNGAARIEYKGVTEARAEALLSVPKDPEVRSALEEAMEFLRGELHGGPVMANAVKERARSSGISERTLLRAKSVLGVISRKEGDGGWSWHLPGKEDRKAAK